MKNRFALMLLPFASAYALAASHSSAPAAPATPTAPETSKPAEQIVFVSGSKDPDWKTYQAFVAGVTLYEQLKELAPKAPLRFVLRAQQANTSLEGVTLRIAGENTSTNVPIAADGTFSVPVIQAALEDKAELVLNRKKGTFRWRPDIHTPGIPPGKRRLGDLRLECEVRWAIEQDELPYLMRKVFNASGGPCHSAQIQVDFLSAKPISAIQMVDKSRRYTLPKSQIEANGHIYHPPVHDKSWPDDTLVEFEFVAADKGQ